MIKTNDVARAKVGEKATVHSDGFVAESETKSVNWPVGLPLSLKFLVFLFIFQVFRGSAEIRKSDVIEAGTKTEKIVLRLVVPSSALHTPK